MDGYGAMGLLPVLVVWVLTVIPIWRILTRVGYSGAWALLAGVPVVGLVLLWVFAYARWPVEGQRNG